MCEHEHCLGEGWFSFWPTLAFLISVVVINYSWAFWKIVNHQNYLCIPKSWCHQLASRFYDPCFGAEVLASVHCFVRFIVSRVNDGPTSNRQLVINRRIKLFVSACEFVDQTWRPLCDNFFVRICSLQMWFIHYLEMPIIPAIFDNFNRRSCPSADQFFLVASYDGALHKKRFACLQKSQNP